MLAVVILCAQLMRDLLATAEFLVEVFQTMNYDEKSDCEVSSLAAVGC